MKCIFWIIIFSSIFAGSLLSATVSVPDMAGGSGGTALVPINADNPTGIAGFQLTLSFDPNVLEATSASVGGLTSGWLIYANTDVPGKVSVVGLASDLLELEASPGSLAIIYFLVKGGIGSTTPMSFSEGVFRNALAENIPVSMEPGTFTVDMQIGDINGDGTTNISDVILCLRIAIGLPVTIGGQVYDSPYPSWLLQCADINLSGDVNISDVILILRKSIGLPL